MNFYNYLMELLLNKNINNNSIKSKNRYMVEKNSINNNNNMKDITQKYDQKYISIINKLSSLISNFHLILKKIITDIFKVSLNLGNQIISSQNLILEINKNNEKYFQLNERIEMINDIKKLVDNNLSILNKNLNIFISQAKKNFKELKKLRNQQIIKNYKINQNSNFKSVSRDKITKDYNNLLNSISKESYSDEKEEKNRLGKEKFIKNPNMRYFNSLYSQIDDDFNSKINENLFKNNEYNYFTPLQNHIIFNNNNNYKKNHLNKSQEIILSNDMYINNRNYSSLINNRINRNNKKFIKSNTLSKNNSQIIKNANINNSNKINISPID